MKDIFIKDPLIELLAIKLYEHDHQDGQWPSVAGDRLKSWMMLADDDRENYRRMAQGMRPIPTND